MDQSTSALLLRIYTGESEHWQGKPLHLAIVEKARAQGLAGATVLRGAEGYGASSVIHTTRLLELSADLPIVIDIVDEESRIRAFLETANEMIRKGLAILQPVEIFFHRSTED